MPAKLAEREMIRILTKFFETRETFPLDFDDDVAAVPLFYGKWLILKTDMLVASTDVPPGMSLSQAARKAVVATVSDFAAKGVRPKFLLVSLGLPGSITRRAVTELGAGLSTGAREYGCRIVGGDTSQCNDLVIDCIGAGECETGMIIRRSGASTGDIVAVTGLFGNSSVGLRILSSRNRALSKDKKGIVRHVLNPKARLKEGLALARSKAVSSSMDSSDGLAWTLHELARASNVSIHLNTVPLSPQAKEFGEENGIPPLDLALYGGEEYELVVTVRRKAIERARRIVPGLIPIGTVHEPPVRVTAHHAGKTIPVERWGWEHFRIPRSS